MKNKIKELIKSYKDEETRLNHKLSFLKEHNFQKEYDFVSQEYFIKARIIYDLEKILNDRNDP